MFSKKSDELPSSTPPANPGRDRMASKSNSTFSVDLHIDGSVEGDIACSSLVQGETSTVKGAIKAESARLAGTVEGSITARELVILKSARIMGDVFYDALTIEQGAQVEGRFAHRDTKAKASATPQGGTKPELTVAG